MNLCVRGATEEDSQCLLPSSPELFQNPLCYEILVSSSWLAGGCRSPGVKKKRFVSRQCVTTAVAVDLRALIKEACFVWRLYQMMNIQLLCCPFFSLPSRQQERGRPWLVFTDACRNDYEAAGCCWTVQRRLDANTSQIPEHPTRGSAGVLPNVRLNVRVLMFACLSFFPGIKWFFQKLLFSILWCGNRASIIVIQAKTAMMLHHGRSSDVSNKTSVDRCD